jgi:hypothetical protein
LPHTSHIISIIIVLKYFTLIFQLTILPSLSFLCPGLVVAACAPILNCWARETPLYFHCQLSSERQYQHYPATPNQACKHTNNNIILHLLIKTNIWMTWCTDQLQRSESILSSQQSPNWSRQSVVLHNLTTHHRIWNRQPPVPWPLSELDELSPYPQILRMLKLSSNPHLGHPSKIFPSDVHVLHAPPISPTFNWSP